MKLLFDQNLSPRLPRLLEDLYPYSAHIRDLGMRDATDTEIWDYAKANGFAIVSKDSDFQARSLLRGPPPQVHLAPGWKLSGWDNRGPFAKSVGGVHTFHLDPQHSHLMLP